jgi:hypothetical protein
MKTKKTAPVKSKKAAPAKAKKAAPAKKKAAPMKSKKNLTRFTYESAAFEGWRLCISRAGTTFTRYFPDKKLGGPRKALNAAEAMLGELKTLIEGSRKVDGKLSATTIRKAEKLIKDAV